MGESIIRRSVELAEHWQKESNRIKSKRQIEFDEKVAKMVRNPVNKVFLTELIDQSFRPSEAKRVANQLTYLLSKYEKVDLFDAFESLLIELFNKVGKHLPQVSVPAIVNRIRNETASVILEGEKEALIKHIDVSPEQLATFGDGNNDIPMFQLSGFSAAMDHAWPEAKKAATLVVPDGDPAESFARGVAAMRDYFSKR